MLEKIDLQKLKKEDITKTARNFSEELAKEGFNSNQIRKYYNNLMALKNKYASGSDCNFDRLSLDLGIFASKIEYGLIKADKKTKKSFEFYRNAVVALTDKVDSFEKFKNFMIVMEAVVAYFPKTN